MNDKFQHSAEQAAAFQKIWLESLTKTMQAAWTSNSNSPPPELMRQMRAGLFEALAQSWEQFLRSPEFLEVMRQWMDQAVSFRKMTNDFVAKARKEMQSPSTEDIDNLVLAMRHMEKRVLDRMEELSAQVTRLEGALTFGGARTQPTDRPGKTRGKGGLKPRKISPFESMNKTVTLEGKGNEHVRD